MPTGNSAVPSTPKGSAAYKNLSAFFAAYPPPNGMTPAQQTSFLLARAAAEAEAKLLLTQYMDGQARRATLAKALLDYAKYLATASAVAYVAKVLWGRGHGVVAAGVEFAAICLVFAATYVVLDALDQWRGIGRRRVAHWTSWTWALVQTGLVFAGVAVLVWKLF